MSSHSMIYVGIYALIYLHTILGEGMDSRDGLPPRESRVAPYRPAFWKLKKYCLGMDVHISVKLEKFSSRRKKQLTAKSVRLPYLDSNLNLAWFAAQAFRLKIALVESYRSYVRAAVMFVVLVYQNLIISI